MVIIGLSLQSFPRVANSTTHNTTLHSLLFSSSSERTGQLPPPSSALGLPCLSSRAAYCHVPSDLGFYYFFKQEKHPDIFKKTDSGKACVQDPKWTMFEVFVHVCVSTCGVRICVCVLVISVEYLCAYVHAYTGTVYACVRTSEVNVVLVILHLFFFFFLS